MNGKVCVQTPTMRLYPSSSALPSAESQRLFTGRHLEKNEHLNGTLPPRRQQNVRTKYKNGMTMFVGIHAHKIA